VVVRNDMERVQALRLCRRMLRHAPQLFPRELARCLTSLARGGAEERDKMLRACLATLSELCEYTLMLYTCVVILTGFFNSTGVLNAPVFIANGGVSAISHNILEPNPPRVIEALAGVLLFLLTRVSTRQLAMVDLSVIAAPYSDAHYRHSFYERDKDERDVRLGCAKLALLSVLRSFPGVLHFCQPDKNSDLRSLVEVLMLRQLEARKAVLDLLYDLLGFPLPAWTDEASVALEAVDPSKMQDGWKLTEGFVAAEGKSILPNLSRFRPNLVDVHTALLLYSFVSAGLLEALVEVIVTSDSFISLRAAILLGQYYGVFVCHKCSILHKMCFPIVCDIDGEIQFMHHILARVSGPVITMYWKKQS
jgi:rapamycin-insensitive companion of mTOR